MRGPGHLKIGGQLQEESVVEADTGRPDQQTALFAETAQEGRRPAG